jgi:hypothetical protein
MATKARLHWLWRGMIAAAIGAICLTACIFLDEHATDIMQHLRYALGETGLPDVAARGISYFIWGLPPSLGAVLAYGLLTRWFGPVTDDGETHCRKCDHILRGLSAPRCPECGEAI